MPETFVGRPQRKSLSIVGWNAVPGSDSEDGSGTFQSWDWSLNLESESPVRIGFSRSSTSSSSASPAPAKSEKTKRAAPPGKDTPEASVPPQDVDAAADEEECDVELEADSQPAHSAEALDVLAAIELKPALLREKLYVEKMEALAWVEALAANGTCCKPIVCARFYASFY